MALFGKIKEKIAGLEAGIISILLMAVFGIYSITFAGIWFALLISSKMGSQLYGFGVVAAIFTFIFLFIVIARKKSIKPLIEDTIIENNKDK